MPSKKDLTDKQLLLLEEIKNFCEMCVRDNIYPVGMELTNIHKKVWKNLEAKNKIEIFSSGYNSKYNYAKIKTFKN